MTVYKEVNLHSSHLCCAFVLCAALCKTSFGCHLQALTLIPLEDQTHLQLLAVRR